MRERQPSAAGEAVIAKLENRQQVFERVMIVVAHPDDETIGIGAQLCRFDNAVLVHLTDGAPRDGRDAFNYGFNSIDEYAAARRRELAGALARGGPDRLCAIGLDVPDQETISDFVALSRRVADLFDRENPSVVFTHAYEGGHPDHDSAAFAVHAARRFVPAAPAIVEMALYHREGERVVRGDFLPADRPVITIPLDEADLHRKRSMIDCFTTQRWLLAEFPLDCERLRIAPEYDFRQPPHPGTLHYEMLGWNISGARWCDAAAAALAELGLDDLPCL